MRKGVVGGMTDRRASSILLNHDWGATCQLEGSTDRKFERVLERVTRVHLDSIAPPGPRPDVKMKRTFLASSLKEVEFTP